MVGAVTLVPVATTPGTLGRLCVGPPPSPHVQRPPLTLQAARFVEGLAASAERGEGKEGAGDAAQARGMVSSLPCLWFCC